MTGYTSLDHSACVLCSVEANVETVFGKNLPTKVLDSASSEASA